MGAPTTTMPRGHWVAQTRAALLRLDPTGTQGASVAEIAQAINRSLHICRVLMPQCVATGSLVRSGVRSGRESTVRYHLPPGTRAEDVLAAAAGEPLAKRQDVVDHCLWMLRAVGGTLADVADAAALAELEAPRVGPKLMPIVRQAAAPLEPAPYGRKGTVLVPARVPKVTLPQDADVVVPANVKRTVCPAREDTRYTVDPSQPFEGGGFMADWRARRAPLPRQGGRGSKGGAAA